MIPCLLFLITNLLASVMPSRLTRQWPRPTPLPEPTAEAGYPRTGRTASTPHLPFQCLQSIQVGGQHGQTQGLHQGGVQPLDQLGVPAHTRQSLPHSPRTLVHGNTAQHWLVTSLRGVSGGTKYEGHLVSNVGVGGAGWGQLAREARTMGSPRWAGF